MTITATALKYASKFVKGIRLFTEKPENTSEQHSVKPPLFNVKHV